MSDGQVYDNEARQRVGLPVIEGQTNPGGGQAAPSDPLDNPGAPSPAPAAPAAPAPSPAPTSEIDEATLLENLKKRFPHINSLEDLNQPPAPVDQEALRKKKDAEMVMWGLQNQKFDKTTYDNYQRDSAKEPRDIVFQDFAAKHEGKTPQQIQTLFARKYHEDILPEEDNKYSDEDQVLLDEAAADMQREAARILRKKYPAMYKLENEFDSAVAAYEKTQKQNQVLQQRETSYKADVPQILNGFAKFQYNIGDKPTATNPNPERIDVEFDVPADVLKRVEQEFLDNRMMVGFIAQDYSKADVQDAIELRITQLTKEQQIIAVGKRYGNALHLKAKAGRNSLNPDDVHGSDSPVRDEELYARLGNFAPAQN